MSPLSKLADEAGSPDPTITGPDLTAPGAIGPDAVADFTTLSTGVGELAEFAERLQALSLVAEREAILLDEHVTSRGALLSELHTQIGVLTRELQAAKREAEDFRAQLTSSATTMSHLQAESERLAGVARAAEERSVRAEAETEIAMLRLATSRSVLETTEGLLRSAERGRDEYVRYLLKLTTSSLGRAARSWLAFRRDHHGASRLGRLFSEAWRILTLRRPDWLRQHPLFDEEFYVRVYPDVRRSRLRPWWHYMRHGRLEGRAPNAYLDTHWYSRTYPDVIRSGINPLDHYYRHGCWEGRDPGPRFSTDEYLARHPEVAAAGINPLLHHLQQARRGIMDAEGP